MKYHVQFKDINNEKPDNLIFSIRGSETEYSDLQKLGKNINGILEQNSQKEIIIDWEWPYETGKKANLVAQNDKVDTHEGEKLESYKFRIIVTGEEAI